MMNQVFFGEYYNDFSKRVVQQNGLTIEMNEFFMQKFDDSPIMVAFREIPKDLKIIVNQKTYTVMQLIYDNVRKTSKTQNGENEVVLNADNDTIFSYIIDLLNGKVVHLTYKESLLLRVMSKDLYFNTIYDIFENQSEDNSIDISISPIPLISFISNSPKNFTINTKNNSYKCNKISACVSQVILNSIKSDNSIESFFYDFDDENNEFQIICKYLNFEEIEILPENLEILKKIANDLKFDVLKKILMQIENQQTKFEEVLTENQSQIDLVDDLFDILTMKGELEAVNYIIQSSWLNNDENQKELFGSLISMVYNSPKFSIKTAKIISILFEQIESIQKSDGDKTSLEKVDLKLLKKFLIRKVVDNVEDCQIGPFLYELIRLDFIKLNKINSNFGDDDDSDLLFRCLKYQSTAIWILPELDEIISGLENYFNSLQEPRRYSLKHLLESEYRQNNWEKIRTFRETKIIPDSIANSIVNDDIDQFQKLFYLPQNDESNGSQFVSRAINKKPLLRSFGIRKNQKNNKNNENEDDKFNNRIPFFEFDLYSNSTYLDYAAFHGSIRCFKFLLLGGAKVTCFTFDAAIEGGNIEIVRITEQKLNENNDDSFYNGKKYMKKKGFGDITNSHLFEHYRDDLIMHPNGLERAIYNHKNDIFDWIFENKNIDKFELGNLLQIASLSNNLHVISSLLYEKPLITNKSICQSFLKSISNASSLGFTLCVKILIDFLGKENFESFSNQYSIDFNSYIFDNVEIFKMTWFKENDFQLLINLCCCNSLSIFKYCYKESTNKKCYEFLINFAIKNNNDEIFNFLFNQINQSEESIQKEIIYNKLLKNTVKCNCLPILKYLLKDEKSDEKYLKTITKCLIIAAKKGYEDIFEYIFNSTKNILNNSKNEQFVNEILMNFFGIIQSGSIKIIKLIIQFIENESYIKMMMFNLLAKESDKIIQYGIESANKIGGYKPQSKVLKSIFLIKNVAEFLISYVDEVIPEFLIAATQIGNINVVKSIVQKNSSYNFLNKIFNPIGNALSIACNNNYNEIALFLLNSCSEIDPTVGYKKNGIYLTPLVISIANQNLELIHAIISFYHSHQIKEHKTIEKSNNDPLVHEIEIALSSIFMNRVEINRKFEEILSYLISIDGININEIYCKDLPLLDLIVDDKLIGIFNHVLSLPNVNPNIVDLRLNKPPLIKAIENDQNKIVSALLNHKDIDINLEAFYHVTALSVAVSTNNVNVVELLVKNEKLIVDLNYSVCLFFAIKSNYIDCVKLLISRPECNVNEIIPYLYKQNVKKTNNFILQNGPNFVLNNNNNNNLNQTQKFINLNLSILEKESKYYSISIIEAAAKSDNIEIVKLIVNHSNFVPSKSTLMLALFESIKIDNSEIFELLLSLYLKLDTNFDIYKLFNLSFNSIVVIASASNNIDFIRLIPDFLKKQEKEFSSFYINQLAFIFAPSVEMMNLIIHTLPGVDLSLPLENGSNYLTALIDFYLSPSNLIEKEYENEQDYNNNNNVDDSRTREEIVIEKVEFVLANSNLKLTTKDKNGFSFLMKATSRSHCIYYLQMTEFIYKRFKPSNGYNESSILVDEETKMNPLHMVLMNIQLMKFYSNNKERYHFMITNNNFHDCEDDFDVLVNLFIIENCSGVSLIFDDYHFKFIFFNNSDLFTEHADLNFINDHLNSVDVLNQTPLIKAVLNMNIIFATFLFVECNADIEIVDVFGNKLVDYLLIIIDYFIQSFNKIPNLTPALDYHSVIEKRKLKKEENERNLCSMIFDDLKKYFTNDNCNCNLIVSIIIKLSDYLVLPNVVEL